MGSGNRIAVLDYAFSLTLFFVYTAFFIRLEAETEKEIPLPPASGKEGEMFSGSRSVV
jgi:hypothetical protein